MRSPFGGNLIKKLLANCGWVGWWVVRSGRKSVCSAARQINLYGLSEPRVLLCHLNKEFLAQL